MQLHLYQKKLPQKSRSLNMDTFKQIVCAIDLSETSDEIIDTAKSIAQVTHASISVIHTVECQQLSFLNFILNTEENDGNQAALAELNSLLLATKNKLIGAGIQVDTLLEQGSISETIHAYAVKTNADLLIIGAQRSHAIKRLFLGSNALKILRKSACPVLIAKHKKHNTYQRILIGVDFSQDMSTTISMVKKIAPNAEIVLAHFYEIPFEGMLNHYAEMNDRSIERYRTEVREDALKKMQTIADTNHLDPITSSIVVVQGDAVDKLLFLANDYGSDLLVLGKHGNNVAEEWILGSVTNEILNICDQDVLVMPQHSAI
jgi:nucleotide-binding universal stress UspA family protein